MIIITTGALLAAGGVLWVVRGGTPLTPILWLGACLVLSLPLIATILLRLFNRL